jgi:hypothetical protein
MQAKAFRGAVVLSILALAACAPDGTTEDPAEVPGSPPPGQEPPVPVGTAKPAPTTPTPTPTPITPSCAAPASVTRGSIKIITTDPAIESVASVCNSIYFSSGPASGGAAPWTVGWVKKCETESCAATVATAVTTGLHYPARFDSAPDGFYLSGVRPPSGGLGPTPPGGFGATFKLAANGTLASIGAVLDVLGNVTYSRISAIPGYLMVDNRGTGYNHGTWADSTLLKLTAGGATKVGELSGGEVSGNRTLATPSRFFALEAFRGAGSITKVDLTTGQSTAFLTGAGGARGTAFQAFAFGERIVAFEVGAGGLNTQPFTQVVCESDTSCAAPTRNEVTTLPAYGYAGVFGDELVFLIKEGATGTVKSCSKAQMLAGPCVPTTIASGAPLPLRDSFRPTSNGKALFYVSAAGEVVRIGL